MDMKLFSVILSVVLTTASAQFQSVQVPPGAFVEFEFEFINQKPGAGGQAGGAGQGMGQGAGAGQGMGGDMSQCAGAGGGMGGGMPAGMAEEGMPPGGGAGGAGGGQPGGMGMGMMPGMGAGMGGGMPGMPHGPPGGMGMGGMGGMSGMGPGQMPAQMMPPMSGASPMMQGMMMPGAASMMGMMMPTSQMMPGRAGSTPGSPTQQLLTNMVQMALQLRRMYGFNMPLPPMEEPCGCDADCCMRPMDPRRVLPVLSIPMVRHPGCCGCVDCPTSLSPLISGMIDAAVTTTAQQGPPPDL